MSTGEQPNIDKLLRDSDPNFDAFARPKLLSLISERLQELQQQSIETNLLQKFTPELLSSATISQLIGIARSLGVPEEEINEIITKDSNNFTIN